MILRRVAVITAIASLAVLGGCASSDKKLDGTVKPASADQTTTTLVPAATPISAKPAAPSTTAPKATSTTVKAATTSTTAKVTATTAGSVTYANCDAVRAAGKAPIRRGDPGYSTKLDRDSDGIGCES